MNFKKMTEVQKDPVSKFQTTHSKHKEKYFR